MRPALAGLGRAGWTGVRK